MGKSTDDRMSEWLKVYLIFGAASFLLGFAGYLVARPQGIAARFTERWSDLTGRLPIARDLTWLGNPSVPAFSSRKLPAVVLIVPAKTDPKTAECYPLLEEGLKKLSFNTAKIQLSLKDEWETSLQNAPLFYRKFILIGIRNRPADSLTTPGNIYEMAIGVNPYLSRDILIPLAGELTKRWDTFKWTQTHDMNKQLVTIEWNDAADATMTRQMAELCLKVLEEARTGLSSDFEI